MRARTRPRCGPCRSGAACRGRCGVSMSNRARERSGIQYLRSRPPGDSQEYVFADQRRALRRTGTDAFEAMKMLQSMDKERPPNPGEGVSVFGTVGAPGRNNRPTYEMGGQLGRNLRETGAADQVRRRRGGGVRGSGWLGSSSERESADFESVEPVFQCHCGVLPGSGGPDGGCRHRHDVRVRPHGGRERQWRHRSRARQHDDGAGWPRAGRKDLRRVAGTGEGTVIRRP